MTLESKRVAEVFTAMADSGRTPNFGSGYFVTDGLVLTAAHIVPPLGQACNVRPLEEPEWLSAMVLWRGHSCDAALLKVVEGQARDALPGSPPRMGLISGPRRIAARALGFPLAQMRKSGVRDAEEIEGEIVPLSGVKSGMLTVHIRGSVPTADRSGHSPWEGMSGAALFSGTHLVGVVVVHPEHFGSDRLMALPIAAALAEPGFRTAFAREGEELLVEAVDVGGGAPRAGAAAVANFLHQYLGNSGRAVPFGGRDAEFASLDSWVRDRSSNYFLVVGRPGRGKSALLARWWERLQETEDGKGIDTVFVPISIRYDLTREASVLHAAVAGLAAAHGEEAAAQSPEEWRDLLYTYLRRSPPAGRTLLAIFDGLDEASGWTPGPSLFPWQPASGVKVLVSARLTAVRSTAAEWLQELGWDSVAAPSLTLDALSASGVRDVLASAEMSLGALAADETVVGELHAASEGDPLVLGLYLGHLSTVPPETLAREVALLGEEEPGLRGYMARWWAEQEGHWRTGLAGQARAVGSLFNVLACAFGPLPRRELLDLTRRLHSLSGDQFDDAIRALDRFVFREPHDGYVISHPRLTEYRRALLEDDDEVGVYDQLFVAWGRQTVEGLRDQSLTATEAARYIVRHYAEHLERTHADVDSFLDLADPTWAAAWEATVDEPNAHLEDVERALRAASRANKAAVLGNRPAPHIAGEVWCAWIRAHGEAVIELVSGELAVALVRHGLWSERRALGACTRIDGLGRRAAELIALAPILSLAGTHEIRELLPGLRETWSGSQLPEAVVRRLVELGDVGTATRVVQGTDTGDAHALASLALLPVVSGGERGQLVQAILEDLDSSTEDPLKLIDKLTSSVSRDAAVETMGESPEEVLAARLRGTFSWWPASDEYDTIEDAVSRAYALSCLAGWLPSATLEERLEDVLVGLLQRGLPENVDDAVTHLAPWLRGPWFHRALDVLDLLLEDHTVWRVFAWVQLLDSAELNERADLLRRTVDMLPAMIRHVAPNDTADALRGMARHGAGAAVVAAIAELDEKSWDKADFLAAVAPHLDSGDVSRAFSLLRETRAETRDDAMRALLGRLASFGASEARDALAIASTDSDTDERKLATGILRHVDASGLNLASLLAIEDPLLRCAAIAASGRTVRVTGADLLDSLSSFDSSFGDADYEHAALGLDTFDELQRELPQAELTTEDALAACARVVKRGLHERKDEIVIRYFQRLADAAGPPRALDFAIRLSSPDFNYPITWAAIAVRDRLRNSGDATAIREAAARVTDPIQREVVRAVLVHLLPHDKQEAAAYDLLNGLDPGDTELRGSWIRHFIESLPEAIRELSVSQLVPDSLLEGRSMFALADTWARGMRDIVDVLTLEQARRLATSVKQRVRSSERSGARAAVATRMAALGELDEALEVLAGCERDHVAMALRRLADLLPAQQLLRPIELGHEMLLVPLWRGQRAYAWASIGRRIPEIGRVEAWRLFESWLDRKPARNEILVDLALYAPAITKLGGLGAARDLLRQLDVTASPHTGPRPEG